MQVTPAERSKGLGYKYTYDPRAKKFTMDRFLDVESPADVPTHKVWDVGPVLDQGKEGACVGFAWTGWRNCSPVVPSTSFTNEYAIDVYRRATEIDEWPNENWQNSSGTSNQAGAKIMREEKALDSFTWARGVADMKLWLLTKGPVVWTCQWRSGMYRTDSMGFLRVSGSIVGGHALLCYGVDERGNFLVQNSWGRDFGIGGLCKVSPSTMDFLASLGGSWSACAAAEIGENKPTPPDPVDEEKLLWDSIRDQVDDFYAKKYRPSSTGTSSIFKHIMNVQGQDSLSDRLTGMIVERMKRDRTRAFVIDPNQALVNPRSFVKLSTE